ncbi:MAG: TIGR02301 family protein [Pseudomonadota bacterium]
MRFLAIIFLSLLPFIALAQTPTDEERMAAREKAELRIEEDMVRMTSLLEALAKNLGQMHYLRTLCFGDEDQQWRNYMAQMMEVEAANDSAKQREMTQAFNAGYYLEQQRHTSCDQSVSVDVAALAENGRSVARMLGDPYREFDE